MMSIEKAFKAFLTKQARKTEVKIQCYILKGRISNFRFSFIGYKTANPGLHGIHYSKDKNQFYFGTRYQNGDSNLTAIPDGDALKIPSIYRDGFLFVVTEKKHRIIKNSKG